jgi:hypothetical protein
VVPRNTPVCTADIGVAGVKELVNKTFPEKGRPDSRYVGKTIAAKLIEVQFEIIFPGNVRGLIIVLRWQRSHVNVTFISSLAFFRDQLGMNLRCIFQNVL